VRTAFELWDDDVAFTLASNQVKVARSTGALGLLPLALNFLAVMRGAHGGQLSLGDELVDEATSIANAIGAVERPYGALIIAAWRGDQAVAAALISEALADATSRGEGSLITLGELCTAILHNGLRNYDQARAAASRACARNELGYCTALPELVEAAVRSDMPELAVQTADRLTEQTRGSSANWGAGLTARCQALIRRGREADELYEEAISRLTQTRGHAHVARTRLLWGESLRRDGKRSQAREQLRLAHERLMTMGAAGFAARAHEELQATGEQVRRRTHETRDQLTSQEARIARLARDGYSNPRIASQLFISRRTVEYHLHNVFRKLGIRSRVELERVLQTDNGNDTPAR